MFHRYRTEDTDQWVKMSSVSEAQEAEAIVEDMVPGEKYHIQVNTVSYSVESNQPQEVTQTISKHLLISVYTFLNVCCVFNVIC